MQLVLKDDIVIATHPHDDRVSEDLYPGCDIVFYDGIVFEVPCPDPRTDEEKQEMYRSKRRLRYPEIGDQLDMIYWDGVNGTTIWPDTIARIKELFPKT